MLERHETWESTFGNDRDRHGFAGKDTSAVLCRAGIATQRLRGEISRMLDWFRACLRNGWIEGWENRNTKQPIDLMEDHIGSRGRMRTGYGKRALARELRERRLRGLNLPYGPVAERLGLVPPPVPASDDEPDPPPEA